MQSKTLIYSSPGVRSELHDLSVSGNIITVPIKLNEKYKVSAMQVNTGCSYRYVCLKLPYVLIVFFVHFSQITSAVAKEIGLKGHANVFGHSRLADGRIKFDYLSQCNISVGGSSASFVVKVTDNNEPMLLGLDVMIALGWNIASSHHQ